MNYFLLAISICSQVIQDAVLNIASKKMLKTNSDNTLFNLFQFITSFVIFAAISIKNGKISFYTVLFGALFGVVTLLVYFLKIRALSCGALNITILILTSSLILPSLFGVVYGEKIKLIKVVSILLLLFFIYFTLEKKKNDNGKIEKKWMAFTFAAFALIGLIGIMQQIFQASSHADEISSFLAVSFLISSLSSLIMTKKSGKPSVKFTAKHYAFAVICGVTTFAMNYINLYLSGVLPTQFFFPMVNGGSLIATSVCAVLLFKERFTGRQLFGFIGGTAVLIFICLIN